MPTAAETKEDPYLLLFVFFKGLLVSFFCSLTIDYGFKIYNRTLSRCTVIPPEINQK